MKIPNKFLHFATWAGFVAKRDGAGAGIDSDSSIAFVRDQRAISTHGTEYYCGKRPLGALAYKDDQIKTKIACRRSVRLGATVDNHNPVKYFFRRRCALSSGVTITVLLKTGVKYKVRLGGADLPVSEKCSPLFTYKTRVNGKPLCTLVTDADGAIMLKAEEGNRCIAQKAAVPFDLPRDTTMDACLVWVSNIQNVDGKYDEVTLNWEDFRDDDSSFSSDTCNPRLFIRKNRVCARPSMVTADSIDLSVDGIAREKALSAGERADIYEWKRRALRIMANTPQKSGKKKYAWRRKRAIASKGCFGVFKGRALRRCARYMVVMSYRGKECGRACFALARNDSEVLRLVRA